MSIISFNLINSEFSPMLFLFIFLLPYGLPSAEILSPVCSHLHIQALNNICFLTSFRVGPMRGKTDRELPGSAARSQAGETRGWELGSLTPVSSGIGTSCSRPPILGRVGTKDVWRRATLGLEKLGKLRRKWSKEGDERRLTGSQRDMEAPWGICTSPRGGRVPMCQVPLRGSEWTNMCTVWTVLELKNVATICLVFFSL